MQCRIFLRDEQLQCASTTAVRCIRGDGGAVAGAGPVTSPLFIGGCAAAEYNVSTSKEQTQHYDRGGRTGMGQGVGNRGGKGTGGRMEGSHTEKRVWRWGGEPQRRGCEGWRFCLGRRTWPSSGGSQMFSASWGRVGEGEDGNVTPKAASDDIRLTRCSHPLGAVVYYRRGGGRLLTGGAVRVGSGRARVSPGCIGSGRGLVATGDPWVSVV